MTNLKIQMVDLFSQYQKIKPQINSAIQDVVDTTDFIKGKQVVEFENNLTKFTGSKYAITCANGTDALQIAFSRIYLCSDCRSYSPAKTYPSYG